MDDAELVVFDPACRFAVDRIRLHVRRDVGHQFVSRLITQAFLQFIDAIEVEQSHVVGAPGLTCGLHGLLGHFAEGTLLQQAGCLVDLGF